MDSRSSSERTGSVASAADLGHQKKLSLQTKNDPNLALQEQQPSMFLFRGLSHGMLTAFISGCQWLQLELPAVHATRGSIWKAHQYVLPSPSGLGPTNISS